MKRLLGLQSELNRLFKPARVSRMRTGDRASHRMRSKAYQRLLSHPRVDSVEVDREGYFLWLKPGWTWAQDPGSHCFSVQTLREGLHEVDEALPCDCDDYCKGASK